MNSSTSTTGYAILALLRLRTWTTYELTKQVQRSLHWFWPRAERKLYDEPKRLVAEGLAVATAEVTGKRPKTVYAITDAGRRRLRRWLDEAPAPRSGEFEAMIKVFFADAGSMDQLQLTLQRIRRETLDRIQELGDLTAALLIDPAFPERIHLNVLTVRLQLDQELAILDWTAWADQQIAEWTSTTNPAHWDANAALQEVVRVARSADLRTINTEFVRGTSG